MDGLRFLWHCNWKINICPGKESMAADYLSWALVVAEVGPVLEIVEEARKIIVGT